MVVCQPPARISGLQIPAPNKKMILMWSVFCLPWLWAARKVWPFLLSSSRRYGSRRVVDHAFLFSPATEYRIQNTPTGGPAALWHTKINTALIISTRIRQTTKLEVLDNSDYGMALEDELRVLDWDVLCRFCKLRKIGCMLQILSSSHWVAFMIICKGLASMILQNCFDQQCLDSSAALHCVLLC